MRGEERADLEHRLAVARGDEPADLVLTGGRVLSVFTGELVEADVAIAGEHVAGLGDYDGWAREDVSGTILVPGFIDAHMHLESTKLMVDAFAEAALPHGTTTVVVDPHEIANVFGIPGVHMLFEAAEQVPLDYYLMVPPCVPASRFESSGATLDAHDVASVLHDEPRAIGLAEFMDFPGVIAGNDQDVDKLLVAHDARRHVDGHAPGLSGNPLNAYIAAGIRSDHECATFAEALEKRRLGMQVILRQGSAARDLEALVPLVLRYGPANCMLCTDDLEPDDLVRDGHLNAVVRRAVELGCPPVDAVTMATLNAARYHELPEHGAIAPGFLADIAVLPDLNGFRPLRVYKRGALVAAEGRAIGVPRVEAPAWARSSMHAVPMSASDFSIPSNARFVRVIDVDGAAVTTAAATLPARVAGGAVVADVDRGVAKAAVIERHHATGRVGLGLVRGFGLRGGALASTIAHDAHNIVVVGMNDADMAAGAMRLAEIGGGQVAVRDGQVLAEVPCPIAGLLSDRTAVEVAAQVGRLRSAAAELGSTLPAPFMTLSFLALSVIPALRLTDRGLFDSAHFELVPLAVG
ncbi:MAG TPA: adenine deaminase [Acidimicrobiales bacterium]|nr:adenine deaminase [Acidimicrobiales bacterium]